MFLGVSLDDGQLFFTSNFMLTNPPLHTFLLVPQAWTIAIELTFYLIAPFIVRKKNLFVFILLLLSVGLKIGLYTMGYQNDPWSYRFFPSELHLFLLGVLAYKIFVKIRTRNVGNMYLWSVLLFNIVLVLFCSQIRDVIGDKIDIFFIIIFFVSIPFIFLLSKSWRLDSRIGDLSYPIYISHVFIYILVSQYNIPLFVENKGLSVALYSIIFSFFLNKIIYNKIEKFRQNRVRKY